MTACRYQALIPVERIDAQSGEREEGVAWRCDWPGIDARAVPPWLVRQCGGGTLLDMERDCAVCPVRREPVEGI